MKSREPLHLAKVQVESIAGCMTRPGRPLVILKANARLGRFA